MATNRQPVGIRQIQDDVKIPQEMKEELKNIPKEAPKESTAAAKNEAAKIITITQTIKGEAIPLSKSYMSLSNALSAFFLVDKAFSYTSELHRTTPEIYSTTS